MKYNPDNAVLEFISTLAAFIGLNVLFLVTCLPVFTIGPAFTALYTVTLREARGENGYYYSTYLKAFRKSFSQAAPICIVQIVLAMIFLFNVVFWGEQHTFMGTAILFVLALLLMLLLFSFFYVYPLLARFQNTVRQTVKNSVLIALSNPKATAGLLAILVVTTALCFAVPQAKIFMVLLGFSFLAYCNSLLFVRVFEKYEEPAEQEVLQAPEME